ncbi:MAG TPA: phenylalanine--tRNA ligase beta subunit-related protein [Paludibacter sp.]|nr:phenylalanine--tRNA ligase beta subunit-related protein [Paludibacter sp.]
MNIEISSTIKEACPEIQLGIITCAVKNSTTSDELWTVMESEIEKIHSNYLLEEINKRLEIAATRKIYKTLGKDPNRYRPSAEALCRRIVREIPVYKVNTIVDIINIVSIKSGFSIGGFDADKIQGDINLGAGTANDEFDAIGRGLLNVEGLPLYRDNIGGIGTPTSDNERTKITDDTSNLLIIINSYSGIAGLQQAVEFTSDLLKKYAKLTNYDIKYLS